MKRPVSLDTRLDRENVDGQLGFFFEKHSWMTAKSTDFQDLNFAFQSLLQGYG
jgi:hypothetical protein